MALKAIQEELDLQGISDYEQIASFLEFNYEFRNNVVSNKVECRTIPKLKKVNTKAKRSEPVKSEWGDMDENKILFHLNASGWPCNENKLGHILVMIMDRYDPFLNYFESLPKWDKKTDYIEQLCSYVTVKDEKGKCDNQVRWNNHLKKHIVRTIVCAINNEYVNKHCIVLQGGQHAGKSIFCRFLCPPILQSYFTENINTDKDSIISLCNNMLINLDELATISKFELNALKAMMSKQYVNIRIPFAKRAQLMPRRCTFIGNTNNVEFLSDHTGSVRWLCYEVDKIDFAYSTDIDINKVYAQAYQLYKDGFVYSLTRDEIKQNEEMNERHFIVSPEMDMIVEYFRPAKKTDSDAKFVTPTYILNTILRHTLIKNLTPKSVGSALIKLGFEKESHFDTDLKQTRKGHWVKEIEQTNNNTAY
jgi:predicted P-loop ATPase